MGLFGRSGRKALHNALEALQADVVQLQQQLASAEAERAVLDARLSALSRTTASLQSDRPVVDPLMLESIESLQRQVDTLSDMGGQVAERLTVSDAVVRANAEQLAAMHERLQSVSTELANQLSELGRDLDVLAEQQLAAAANNTAGDHTNGNSVSDELVETLRAGQVRLANEQARYEIAFRADLAELAERIQRLRH